MDMEVTAEEDAACMGEAQAQVFQTYHVFQKIMSYLSVDEKKKCRLVCKDWRNEFTNNLLRRQDLCLNIFYNRFERNRFEAIDAEESTGQEEYYIYIPRRITPDSEKVVDYKKESLNALNLLMQRSYKFPCNYLRISCGNLKDRMLQDFLQLFGKFVKRLDLIKCGGSAAASRYEHHSEGRYPIECEDFQNLVLYQLVNLEQLELIPCEHHFAQIREEDKLFKLFMEECWLPNMKKLVLTADAMPSSVLKYLLKACTLLAELEFYVNADNVLVVEQAGRLRNIRELTLNPTEDSITGWEYLLSSCIKNMRIGSLNISGSSYDPSRISAADLSRKQLVLQNSLSAFASTLMELNVTDYNLVSEYLRCVAFRNLKRLKLSESTALDIPAGTTVEYSTPEAERENRTRRRRVVVAKTYSLLSLSDTFPQLMFLDLALVPGDVKIEDVFGVTPTPSLVHLILRQVQLLPISWFEKFPSLFPSLRCLELRDISKFDQIAQYLWKWPSLEQIKLVFTINQYEVDAFEIDSAFTGFSISKCQDLRLSQENESNHIDEEDSPSIRDLPRLTGLIIEVAPTMSTGESNRYPFYISSLSGKFAFQHCPRLNKILAFTKEKRCIQKGNHPGWRNSYEEILPYVNSYI